MSVINDKSTRDEVYKWALLGVVSWIALQVTDLKQSVAAVIVRVDSVEARTNRIADSIVRLMASDTAMSDRISGTEQRTAKLEAKVFKF